MSTGSLVIVVALMSALSPLTAWSHDGTLHKCSEVQADRERGRRAVYLQHTHTRHTLNNTFTLFVTLLTFCGHGTYNYKKDLVAQIRSKANNLLPRVFVDLWDGNHMKCLTDFKCTCILCANIRMKSLLYEEKLLPCTIIFARKHLVPQTTNF